MDESHPFEFPEIIDEQIRWASRLLGLPEDAFHGEDGKDPRQHILNCKETIDVAACPGSGKTTLLVAKLAIMAEKWRHQTRGICVLSHTNVARNKIETLLGNTTTGRRLLSYPHYIGTIHHFVNEFLAVPWLRSRGYPIKMIDSEICEKRRWNRLDPKWQFALKKKKIDKPDIRILDTTFKLGKKNGEFPFRENADTYKALKTACQDTAMEGFHCYDDMFIWAHDMMDKMPYITKVLRDRFPLLFVDEAQDNSEEQSEILYRIFMKGESTVIRQRFGDANQAIFDFVEAKEATTDKFPNDIIKRDIPNSHRFGENIAKLADPLGLTPFPSALIGLGPKKPLASGVSEGQHTIFLFKDDEAERVLDSYAEVLVDTFSEQELREGTFTAVGQVHRDKGDNHKPRHVCHYWLNYDSDLSNRDPKPQTFIQYIWAGIGNAYMIGEAFPVVEKMAEGILRLAGMSESVSINLNRRHCHRYVQKLLEKNSNALRCYNTLIFRFAARRKLPTKETWTKRWSGAVRKIAENISATTLSGSDVEEFLAWKDGSDEPTVQSPLPNNRTNMYYFKKKKTPKRLSFGWDQSTRSKEKPTQQH